MIGMMTGAGADDCCGAGFGVDFGDGGLLLPDELELDPPLLW